MKWVLPAMKEMQVRSLGQKDPLDNKMATRSSILAWRIRWTEGPGGLQSMGLQSHHRDPVGTDVGPGSFFISFTY